MSYTKRFNGREVAKILGEHLIGQKELEEGEYYLNLEINSPEETPLSLSDVSITLRATKR